MKIKPAIASFVLFLSGCSSYQLQEKEPTQLNNKTEILIQVKTPEEKFQDAMRAIIKYHEKALNIKYPKEMPEVNFTIPEHISYAQRDFYLASYDEKANYFEFNPIYRHCDITTLLNPENVTSTDDINCNPIFLRGVLSHELGHFFVDSVIEKEFPDSWLQQYVKEKRVIHPEEIGLIIVREGIATYFQRIFDNNKNTDFSDNAWKIKFDKDSLMTSQVIQWLGYEGGYNLVRPIIDAYDLEGIKYLIKEKLEIEIPNFQNILSYRENALLKLAEK